MIKKFLDIIMTILSIFNCKIPCHPKITNDSRILTTLGFNKYILRLNISMNNIFILQIVKSQQQIKNNLGYDLHRQMGIEFHKLSQVILAIFCFYDKVVEVGGIGW